MANAAAITASQRLKSGDRKTYATIVDENCIACTDFSKQFDNSAKKTGLKKIFEHKVLGKRPNIGSTLKKLVNLKPSIILLPNYSKLSSYLMYKIQSNLKNVVFVGGDGWGDSKFGFVQNGLDLKSAKGFTVRGTPPTDIALKGFELGRKVIKNGDSSKFGSSAAIGILSAVVDIRLYMTLSVSVFPS